MSLGLSAWAKSPDPHADSASHGDSAAGHAEGPSEHDADGAAEGGHHEEHAFNFYHGLIGEREGVEPGLLWRSPGTPPPFLAMLINTSLLIFLIYRFAKEPIRTGLRKRKERIMHGMDEARRILDDAARQLKQYEAKLSTIDDEIERVRREMREAAEHERQRALEDAKERSARMQRDANLLVQQELSAAHEALLRETAQAALTSAEELLKQQVSSADQERLAESFVQDLGQAPVGGE